MFRSQEFSSGQFLDLYGPKCMRNDHVLVFSQVLTKTPFPRVNKLKLTHEDRRFVCSGNGSLIIYNRYTDPAVDAGFSHLGSAVNVNVRTFEFLTYFPVSFFSFFTWCFMSSSCDAGFQFLMDFTITEVNTNRHRAENDSCLTCVSISTERFC